MKLAIREGVNKAIHEAEKLTLLFIIPRLSQAREWTFIVGVGGGETGLMSLGPVSSAWLPDPRRRAHADIVETLRTLGRAGLNRVARMDAGNACLYSLPMDVASVSALSALGGSIVGGLISSTTTWLSQRVQVRARRLKHELSRREQLYKDFMISASTAYGDAMVRNDPEIPVIVDLYAMISITRDVSSPRTLACAERVMHETAQTYFEPNVTARELHQTGQGGKGIDPLKEFSEAARAELRTLTPL